MIIFEDFLFIFLMGGANLAKENMQCQLTSCQVLTGYNINWLYHNLEADGQKGELIHDFHKLTLR